MKKKVDNKVKKFIKKLSNDDIFFILISVFITLFFLYQHYSYLAWDFASYYLNGQYLLFSGEYFEWYRPPLMPILLGLFSIFGITGEYLVIFLISLIFFTSLYCLSKTLKFNPLFFMTGFLSPYFFLFATLEGTELLGLGLFMIFLIGLFNKKNKGVFMGLSFLSRYQFLYTIPLIFLYKKPKKILINLFYFLIPVIPWFFYNYFKKGNFFVSIFDGYLMNIKFRDYMIDSFSLYEFLLPFFIFLPLILSGLYFAFKDKKKQRYIFLFLILVFSYSYISTPLKISRYLFLLLLPYSYFSAIALEKINKLRFNIKTLIKILIIFLIILGIFFSNSKIPLTKSTNPILMHQNAIDKIDELGYRKYRIYSDSWTYLNYLGLRTYPTPWQRTSLKNSIFIHFKGYEEAKMTLENHSFLEENGFQIYFTENLTKEPLRQDLTYLEYLKRENKRELEYCSSVFENKILQKVCNLSQK